MNMSTFLWQRTKHFAAVCIAVADTSKVIILCAGLILLLSGPPAAFGQEPLSFSGITEPIADVILSAADVGTISAVFVKEGGSVKKGKIVLELDNQIEAFEVKRRKLIWQNRAELEAAAVKVSTLKSMLDSTRELFETTGSISKDELERIALEHALAVADQKRLDVAEKRERIEYDMARENLRKRSLISPIAGTVIRLFLERGETCQENQALAHVVDTSRCRFVCNVEEWVGRKLENGQQVNMKIKTGSTFTERVGPVVFVSPVIDPASGLLEVKAEFDNRDGAVRPGASGTLELDAPPEG